MDSKHSAPLKQPALPPVPANKAPSKPLPVPTARAQTAIPRVSVAVIASQAIALATPAVTGAPALPPPPSDYVAPVTGDYKQLNAVCAIAVCVSCAAWIDSCYGM